MHYHSSTGTELVLTFPTGLTLSLRFALHQIIRQRGQRKSQMSRIHLQWSHYSKVLAEDGASEIETCSNLNTRDKASFFPLKKVILRPWEKKKKKVSLLLLTLKTTSTFPLVLLFIILCPRVCTCGVRIAQIGSHTL